MLVNKNFLKEFYRILLFWTFIKFHHSNHSMRTKILPNFTKFFLYSDNNLCVK